MLELEEVVSICEELEREYNLIELFPNKSPSGSSTIYIKIKYGKTEWTIRLSDHTPPKGSGVERLNNYIQPKMSRKGVKEYLEGRIRKIKKTNLHNIFDSLNK